jgi:hypothetical protein
VIGLSTATALVVGTSHRLFDLRPGFGDHEPGSRSNAGCLAWAVAGVLTLIGALVCAELRLGVSEDRRSLRVPERDLFAGARLPVGLGDGLDHARRHPRGNRHRVRALCGRVLAAQRLHHARRRHWCDWRSFSHQLFRRAIWRRRAVGLHAGQGGRGRAIIAVGFYFDAQRSSDVIEIVQGNPGISIGDFFLAVGAGLLPSVAGTW